MIYGAKQQAQRAQWEQRRMRIVAAFKRHGARHVADKYGLSLQRIYQIVSREQARP